MMPAESHSATQISVFLENRAGRLGEVISVLAKGNINLRAISLADTSDFGILRLMADNPDKAEELLKHNSFTVGRTSVIVVEMADEPGALDKLLNLLSPAGINVEYMYAYARRTLGGAAMVFRFDNNEAAAALLASNGIKIFSAQELGTF